MDTYELLCFQALVHSTLETIYPPHYLQNEMQSQCLGQTNGYDILLKGSKKTVSTSSCLSCSRIGTNTSLCQLIHSEVPKEIIHVFLVPKDTSKNLANLQTAV